MMEAGKRADGSPDVASVTAGQEVSGSIPGSGKVLLVVATVARNGVTHASHASYACQCSSKVAGECSLRSDTEQFTYILQYIANLDFLGASWAPVTVGQGPTKSESGPVHFMSCAYQIVLFSNCFPDGYNLGVFKARVNRVSNCAQYMAIGSPPISPLDNSKGGVVRQNITSIKQLTSIKSNPVQFNRLRLYGASRSMCPSMSHQTTTACGPGPAFNSSPASRIEDG
uniref:SFRICE_001061 n=1 Tax=Spodoptera frugiperda TaxID=7108 RepID=A0A2H1VHX8_SPOFR